MKYALNPVGVKFGFILFKYPCPMTEIPHRGNASRDYSKA